MAGRANRFVLSGSQSPELDLLGIWSAAQDGSDMPASFDLSGGTSPEPAVFVCDLPANLQQAGVQIQTAESALESSLAGLDAAYDRLDNLVRSQAGGISFSAPGSIQGSPEFQLLALLGAADAGSEWGSTSFEAGSAQSSQWERAAAEFHEFMQRLNQVVGHFAWVETQVNSRLVVRSAVGWTGNLDTAWSTSPTREMAQMHQRTLRLALSSRTAILRAFGVISAGAVKLTALIASPAGAVLALPAAWKFIRQVQAETARYSSIKEEIEHGE